MNEMCRFVLGCFLRSCTVCFLISTCMGIFLLFHGALWGKILEVRNGGILLIPLLIIYFFLFCTGNRIRRNT